VGVPSSVGGNHVFGLPDGAWQTVRIRRRLQFENGQTHRCMPESVAERHGTPIGGDIDLLERSHEKGSFLTGLEVDSKKFVLGSVGSRDQCLSVVAVPVESTHAVEPFACVAAGIVTLWGKSHGGANEAVIHMLEEIDEPKNIPTYVERAKNKDDPFRLMGFGHRVYKNHDPRATIIRAACHDLLNEMDLNQPLFEIAMELERLALEDDYFIERKLYPNVDFYSGLIYQALNIPKSMFTSMFALARSAGWIAQWMEMMGDDDFRIGRPRQLYVGAENRDYVPMAKRA
jgi:hypothetical protein